MKREKLFSEFPPVSTAEWMEAVNKDLKGADFNKKLVWRTPEGFSAEPFYRAENTEQAPSIGGNRSENNNWEIRQDFRIPDIDACNALAAEAAAKGAESVGVCCKNVKTDNDLERLLKGIDPNRTGIHFLCASDYGKLLDIFLDLLQKKHIEPASVKGSIDFDPIAYALLHGEFYAGSFERNMDEAAAIFKKFGDKLPGFKFLSVSGSLLHNAGCYNTQEIAFALNWACDYFAALTDRGIDIDSLCRHTVLKSGIGSDYFMQIAKLRAARLLWAAMTDGFKPKDPKSRLPFIHAESSRRNQSVYDPYVNLLRSATETMSAAIGGADSIHVNDFSEAFRPGDRFSARIARNQQVLLKEESFFNRVIDPSAGSYYIENLTAKLAESVWNLFLETEEKGGMVANIENGNIQEIVAECARKGGEDIARRKAVLTGVNQFPNLNEKAAENIKKTPESKVQKGKFAAIRLQRSAEPFEELRLQTEAYAEKRGGQRPKVFLLTFGNLAMRKARAGFATNFFGCAGYEILDNAGFESGAEGAEAALKSGADITVLCSSDEEYPELAAQACPILKGKTCIVYAGMAAEEDSFRALGVDYFIHIRSNVLETLSDIQHKLIR